MKLTLSFMLNTKASKFKKEDITNIWLVYFFTPTHTNYKLYKNYYSGISIRWTHHKVDISIRRTVNLGTEHFPGQTFIMKSL